MSVEPEGSRANIPGYGITSEPYEITWSEIAAKIDASRNYWISTAREDGRPHAMPVWGVWVDGWLYFGTDPKSVKGRNLARTGEIVVHLESGDDVVILEGAVERVTGVSELTRYADAYDLKYGIRPDPNEPERPHLSRRAARCAYVAREGLPEHGDALEVSLSVIVMHALHILMLIGYALMYEDDDPAR